MRFFALFLAILSTVANADSPVIWGSGTLAKFLPSRGWTLSDGKQYITLTSAPSGGAGYAAPVGSVVVASVAGVGHLYVKTGSGDTSWTDVTTAGSGTVSSVDMTVPSILAVSGNPITTSGTLAVTLSTQAQGKVLAGPIGGTASAVPTFRSLASADMPKPSSTSLGAVFANGFVPSQFFTSLGITGNFSTAQAAFTDISGTAVGAQLPNPAAATKGGIFSKAFGAKLFLTSLGTDATVSNAQVAFTDISGTATGAQLPNPSSSTLGGIQSFAAVANSWINTISTSGVPSATQPAFSNISGSLSRGQVSLGTSSAAIVNDINGVLSSVAPSTAGNLLTSSLGGWVSSPPATNQFTLGSVPFKGVNALAQDNANLFWDDTNNYLGIGTASPQYPLDVRGQVFSSSSGGFLVALVGGSERAKLGYANGSLAENGFLSLDDESATESVRINSKLPSYMRGGGLELGTLAVANGRLLLNGFNSGGVNIAVNPTAGSYNFNLPTGAGTSGQPLLSAGGGTSVQTYGSLSRAWIGTGTSSVAVVNDINGGLTGVAPGTSGNVLTSFLGGWVSASAPSGSSLLSPFTGSTTYKMLAFRLNAPSAGSCSIDSNYGGAITGTPSSAGTGLCNITTSAGCTTHWICAVSDGDQNGTYVTTNDPTTTAINLKSLDAAGNAANTKIDGVCWCQ